jgi:Inner membrane protein YgaP-like, transmembrane domain
MITEAVCRMLFYAAIEMFPAKEGTDMFKTNEGTIDRVLRVIVGAALLVAFFMYPDASWRYFTLIGIIPLVTGLIGICPVYSILGLSTCPMKKA